MTGPHLDEVVGDGGGNVNEAVSGRSAERGHIGQGSLLEGVVPRDGHHVLAPLLEVASHQARRRGSAALAFHPTRDALRARKECARRETWNPSGA